MQAIFSRVSQPAVISRAKASSQTSVFIRQRAVVGKSLRRGLVVRSNMGEKIQKSDADWQKELTQDQFYVLRKKGTERPGTGEYDGYYPTKGYFSCAGCGNPLYSAESKFKSGCGWPAFDKCYKSGVATDADADGRRIEILCAKCDGHLGHVFVGEQFTATNERHCVNSVSVKFVDADPPADLVESKCT
mmetsp:Transcript_26589/g.36717  ORF Transcript_26589/g.36717 Transcript_26589/m.36717 type:complete len:189 (-) Transcript_26589:211-777(-)